MSALSAYIPGQQALGRLQPRRRHRLLLPPRSRRGGCFGLRLQQPHGGGGPRVLRRRGEVAVGAAAAFLPAPDHPVGPVARLGHCKEEGECLMDLWLDIDEFKCN